MIEIRMRFRSTTAACVATTFKYQNNFDTFSKATNAVIYSTLSCLIMALVYFLLRPKLDAKGGKSTRYVIILMLLGTTVSIVALIVVSVWLFSIVTILPFLRPLLELQSLFSLCIFHLSNVVTSLNYQA